MIRINNINLKIGYTEAELKSIVSGMLRLRCDDIVLIKKTKLSIDARKKESIHYICSVNITLASSIDDKRLVSKLKNKDIVLSSISPYCVISNGILPLHNRPIIVGSGPAGLFCALKLSEAGFKPLLIERGRPVGERMKSVEHFWSTGILDTESNVQFGEGGAGTFSDGKLNTMVKDTSGRIAEVLRVFTEHGAPEEITYINKPHIGTDMLAHIVKSIRQRIIECGGEVRFNTKLTAIHRTDNHVSSIVVNNSEEIPCELLVLAIGHSARDTFTYLYNYGIQMEQKPFAVGVRIEHPQEMINRNQYGGMAVRLPAADYKLTHTCENGRGVYSFCMCPGGFVVNASSENDELVINGMSNSKRNERNANSAVVVTVGPKDFGGASPLSGIEYQRRLEASAYKQCGGFIPVQLFGDFCDNLPSTGPGDILPNTKGGFSFSDVRACLPNDVALSIIEGINAFDRSIKGFARKDALLLGVETRTSSPLRILRDNSFESIGLSGLYPCGEGAGYAGGITSAAVDGLKISEAIIGKYKSIG